MIDSKIIFLIQAIKSLEVSIDALRNAQHPRAELHESYKQNMSGLDSLHYLGLYQHILQDVDLGLKVSNLQADLRNDEPFTAEMLARELQGIQTQAFITLSQRKFAFIPSPNDGYFEQEMLFGEDVFEVFPEARQDIKDAGNCIACELYTAVVFHSIRVAEYGLRRIAKRMKITRILGKKTIDISETTWETLLHEMRKKLEAAHQEKTVSASRAKRIAFYSDAADHAKHMQGLWRNGVSHLTAYNQYEAMNAFDRVRGFMQLIARGFA